MEVFCALIEPNTNDRDSTYCCGDSLLPVNDNLSPVTPHVLFYNKYMHKHIYHPHTTILLFQNQVLYELQGNHMSKDLSKLT